MPQPRLQEVADASGLSVATVSRVLNNKQVVSESSRRRVIEAIRKLGGGHLQGAVLGLILPDASNPYFTTLAFKLQDELQRRGIHLLIASSGGSVDREVALIEQFKGLRINGLIYTGAGGNSEALLALIAEGHLPIVVLDRQLSAGNVDSVVASGRTAIAKAVAYLIASGHRRIGCLHGLLDTETGRERLDSFTTAMSHDGQDVEPGFVFAGDYTLEAGRSCADELNGRSPDGRPTAMVVANDLMAIGLAERLKKLDWVLPQELSIVGFDNIFWSEAIFPALTTVEQPIPQMVAETCRILEARLTEYAAGTGPASPPRSVILECSLVVRDSVVPPGQLNRSTGAASAARQSS